jgi:hypothetical protein
MTEGNIADNARKHVEECIKDLEGENDFMPFLTYNALDGTHGYVGLATMGDQAEKDATGDYMAAILAANQATEAVFASASWMVKAQKGEAPDETTRVMPSEHPRRVECAFFMHHAPDKVSLHSAEIFRKDNKVSLGEWEVMEFEGEARLGGRFGDAITMGMTLGKNLPPEALEYIKTNLAEGKIEEVLRPMAKAFAGFREHLDEQARKESGGT